MIDIPVTKSHISLLIVVGRRGFTVLELVIVLSIMAVLAAILFPVTSGIRKRAQRVQCTANLRSLYLGAEHYVQDNNQWPQVATKTEDESSDADVASQWVATLAPYGITSKTWICPTIQNLLGNPDYYSAGNARLDYTAMPFDDKPMTPHQWPRQPWFVENGDMHGHGNLIIFTDGSVSDLKSITGK